MATISSDSGGTITIHGVEYSITKWGVEYFTEPIQINSIDGSVEYASGPFGWGGEVEFIACNPPTPNSCGTIAELVLKTGTREYRGKALITSCDLNTSDSKNFSITAGFEGQEELESKDEPDLAKSGFLTALEVEWDEELLAKDSKESLPNPQEVWYNKLPLWAQRIRNLELD